MKPVNTKHKESGFKQLSGGSNAQEFSVESDAAASTLSDLKRSLTIKTGRVPDTSSKKLRASPDAFKMSGQAPTAEQDTGALETFHQIATSAGEEFSDLMELEEVSNSGAQPMGPTLNEAKNGFLEAFENYDVRELHAPYVRRIDASIAKIFDSLSSDQFWDSVLRVMGPDELLEIQQRQQWGEFLTSRRLDDFFDLFLYAKRFVDQSPLTRPYEYPADPSTAFYIPTHWQGVNPEGSIPQRSGQSELKFLSLRADAIYIPTAVIKPFGGRVTNSQLINPQKLAIVLNQLKKQTPLSPITVNPFGSSTFEIQDGVHRFHASVMLGISAVPVSPGGTLDNSIFSQVAIERGSRAHLGSIH